MVYAALHPIHPELWLCNRRLAPRLAFFQSPQIRSVAVPASLARPFPAHNFSRFRCPQASPIRQVSANIDHLNVPDIPPKVSPYPSNRISQFQDISLQLNLTRNLSSSRNVYHNEEDVRQGRPFGHPRCGRSRVHHPHAQESTFSRPKTTKLFAIRKCWLCKFRDMEG